MYMLLHGWRACLSAKNCVRVVSRGRARPRVCRCASWSGCVRVQVRARVYLCVCARVCAQARLLVWLCARACTACVNERRVRAPRRCARPPIARRRLAVFIARLAPRVAAARARLQFGATGRLSRAFGRRCHLDVPHGQRAMGCAMGAHVRGRRRRRHLRPRRHHQRPRLARRVGEHRRRCAAEFGQGGYSRGYLGGTTGILRGTTGVQRGT